MVENYIAIISDEERLIVENYVAGVNKVAENLHFYPLEFYMFWQNFEPFTIEDSIAIQYLTTIFVSGDWFYEMVRERLLEVYTRDMVDRIFPFQKEHMYPFKNLEMVNDKEI
jgi:acyl-homoserine lactone acylase PvdQ